MPKAKMKAASGKAGSMIPGKQAVGNTIIKNRGYGEGQPGGGELIGAKKLSGPKKKGM